MIGWELYVDHTLQSHMYLSRYVREGANLIRSYCWSRLSQAKTMKKNPNTNVNDFYCWAYIL